MDVLTDDHEREQVVKKWWHENWKPILLGVAIALGGLIGWRQYQQYQLHQAQEQAYALYQLETKLALRAEGADAEAQNFVNAHEDIYGALLSLDLAAAKGRAGDYAKAEEHARFASLHGGDLVAPAAALVQARLQAQQERYDEALTTLGTISSAAYAIEKAETTGDIALAKGERSAAHDAYKQALDLSVERGVEISPLLHTKFDSVTKGGDRPGFEIASENKLKLLQSGALTH